MTEDLIERIRGLCKRLVEVAPWWAGWWTPLPEERLEAFELEHGVVLPNGYRRLLREIGDRAPIPGRPRGGLLELERARVGTTADDRLGRLDRPFAGAGDQPVELEWDDDADDWTDPAPLAGCLPILDGGCDTTCLLVVTGADRGRVWSFTPSGAPQLRPTRTEFLTWYADELERGLAPLVARAETREGLERRVAERADDLQASVALGRELLLFDRARARELLERAWETIESLDPGAQIELRRAIAELDLLDDRRDRIDAMADGDDWLRTYAGIAAARSGNHKRAIERLEGATIPVLLRSAAIGHLALAHAARGRVEHAIALLRATQASTSNHAIAARLRSSLGQRE
ncbi:MAG TPA: SMI1/KNR4 family protein, partial [Enhygromyxa sp.]|nr:SMI1/KNR4 family protein [Enhygromyxa sp.]